MANAKTVSPLLRTGIPVTAMSTVVPTLGNKATQPTMITSHRGGRPNSRITVSTARSSNPEATMIIRLFTIEGVVAA